MTQRRTGTLGERGSAGIWVLAAAALLILLAVAVVVRGTATLARHRAETAADAAALAAAGQIGVGSTPCGAATTVAAANGAQLHDCQLVLSPGARSGQVAVVVTISVTLPIVGRETVQARARAERRPG